MRELEVYAAQTSSTYDFILDENVPLCILAEEVISVICQREQSDPDGDMTGAVFYSRRTGEVYDMTKTLNELGLMSGETVCIV